MKLPSFCRSLPLLIRLVLVSALLFSIAGCSGFGAAKRSDRLDLAAADRSATLSTLTANIRFSYAAEGRHGSLRGMLAYRAPDMLRVVLLNPFGTVLTDIVVQQQLLTIVYPAQQSGFEGPVSALPPGVERDLWRAVRWMLEPAVHHLPDGSHRLSRAAGSETVTILNGVMVSRERDSGEQLRFDQYTSQSDILFAEVVTYETSAGDRVRFVFDDAVVNESIDDATFILDRRGLRLLPLSTLRSVQ